jgi:lysophospholipase L1-like esterase
MPAVNAGWGQALEGAGDGSVTGGRRAELAVAAGLTLAAVAISPWAIQHLTGRPVLTVRVTAISIGLDLFLLATAFAIAAQGRVRKLGFHLMLWTFPLALLAALEAAAIAVHFADRVAPLEDNSSLRNWSRWPAYLMSEGRWAEPEGTLRVYRPWKGDGVEINEFGLRGPAPAPKTPGEWRIAVTGGSTAYGWRVFDADTIPAQLQNAIDVPGRKVTVHNFGIEGASLEREIALVRRLRDAYALDQVIFYTGANDVILHYMNRSDTTEGLGELTAQTTGFELIKAARRLLALWFYRSSRVDQEDAASVARTNSLREQMAAARSYCDGTGLRCDFFLVPMLFTCKSTFCRQSPMAGAAARVYPGLDRLMGSMYADALAHASAEDVEDLRDAFDQSEQPIYTDFVHVNEEGNRLIAERIADVVEQDLAH